MSLRKPTLDEWFSAYQLASLGRDSFHNPGHLEVDITALVRRYQDAGQRLSYPALVMKAYALTARQVPAINRAYLRTPLGDRIVEFDHISVNMPVALYDDGAPYLSALVVKHADRISVNQIAGQIRAAQQRPIETTKLTRLVARKPNTLLWRSVLRSAHFAAYRWPALMAKAGGGLSLSSLLEHRPAPPHFHAASFGPTATTLLLTGVRQTDSGRYRLELGVSINHTAATGLTWRRMVTTLSDLLESESSDVLAQLD